MRLEQRAEAVQPGQPRGTGDTSVALAPQAVVATSRAAGVGPNLGFGGPALPAERHLGNPGDMVLQQRD